MSAPAGRRGLRERERLERDVSAFVIAREAERRELFARHLAQLVRWTSPLVVAAFGRTGAAWLAGLIRPPQFWPEWGLNVPPSRGGWFRPRPGPGGGWALQRAHERLLRGDHYGAVVRDAHDPAGELRMRVIGRGLEMALTTGGVRLTTRGSFVQVDCIGELPEVVIRGMPGLSVDLLVAHPLLAGRGYRVVRAFAARDSAVLVAATGRVPLRLPAASARAAATPVRRTDDGPLLRSVATALGHADASRTARYLAPSSAPGKRSC